MESARCKAFIAAADSGSFSKAAEMLSYTPSGVSQLVNSLDKASPVVKRFIKYAVRYLTQAEK